MWDKFLSVQRWVNMSKHGMGTIHYGFKIFVYLIHAHVAMQAQPK